MTQSSAYIGIGSNLANPIGQVEEAIERLKVMTDSVLCAVSPFYKSTPIGQAGQDDYVNAVAHVTTNLPPLELLDSMQAIETAQGRTRDGTRWGARTLDLDLLLYDQEIIRSDRLLVPHPEMGNRIFVLQPLRDVVTKGFSIPLLGDLDLLLRAMDCSGISLIESSDDDI